MEEVASRRLDPMSIGRAQPEVDASQAASAGGEDALGVADHFDRVRRAVLAEKSGEEGTGGADLLRLAQALAREAANPTVRIALGRVVVGNEPRKAAEVGPEGEVEGVTIMATFTAKVPSSGGMNGAVDQVDVDRDTSVGGESAPKTIDPREAARGDESGGSHCESEDVSPDEKVVLEGGTADALAVVLEVCESGSRSGAVPAGLERDGPVEATGRQGAARGVGVDSKEAGEPSVRLRVVTTEGREEETMGGERDAPAPRAEEVNEQPETPQ